MAATDWEFKCHKLETCFNLISQWTCRKVTLAGNQLLKDTVMDIYTEIYLSRYHRFISFSDTKKKITITNLKKKSLCCF